MKSTKFFKPVSENPSTADAAFELLLDSIRSKIVFEIIIKGETTAEQIVESTGKSRSTISHHLKKLVESGLLDVYMNPTGKTKYYRITKDIERFSYVLDKEKFTTETLEDQSDFLVEIRKIFVIFNHIYTNTFSDQIKLIQEYLPFEKISVPDMGDISFQINSKEYQMPYNTFFITGKAKADFVRKGLRKLFKEFSEEFGEGAKPENLLDDKSKHIVNLQILPYLEKKDLEKKTK